MKIICLLGLVLAVCIASSEAASIEAKQQVAVDTKRDIRDIFHQLQSADGFEPAPKPEELTEDFGGDKERQARSYSFSGSFERFRPYGGYGGFGGYGGYGHGGYGGGYGGYGGGYGGYGGHPGVFYG